MSDERKAEKKAKNREKRAKRKAAIQMLRNFAKENTDDPEILKAVEILTPGQRGFVTRTGILDVLKAKFKEVGKISEMDLFQEFKIGRPKMNGICRNFIKKVSDPSDRIWVKLDPENGEYVMVAEGAETPEGWTGYKPVGIADLEIED